MDVKSNTDRLEANYNAYRRQLKSGRLVAASSTGSPAASIRTFSARTA
jgi:hypothetical protein